MTDAERYLVWPLHNDKSSYDHDGDDHFRVCAFVMAFNGDVMRWMRSKVRGATTMHTMDEHLTRNTYKTPMPGVWVNGAGLSGECERAMNDPDTTNSQITKVNDRTKENLFSIMRNEPLTHTFEDRKPNNRISFTGYGNMGVAGWIPGRDAALRTVHIKPDHLGDMFSYYMGDRPKLVISSSLDM